MVPTPTHPAGRRAANFQAPRPWRKKGVLWSRELRGARLGRGNCRAEGAARSEKGRGKPGRIAESGGARRIWAAKLGRGRGTVAARSETCPVNTA